MKKINETCSISELINSTVFGEIAKSDKMNLIIKQSTIFSFWDDIVGKKFINYTKPYLIKGSKIFVSVKSPIIIQELTLNKIALIKKINSYSLPLGIEIKDFVFDYKNFSEKNKQDDPNVVEDKPIWISENEIDNLQLSPEIEKEIKKNINKIKLLNEEQKEKFIKKIIQNYKVKILQNKSNK